MAKKKVTAYKVKVTIGDASVEVEGAESGVIKIVEAFSQSLTPSRRSSSPLSTGVSPSASISASMSPQAAASTRINDVRSFFAEKKPSNDVEAAAAAAYYYQYVAPESQRRETIDSALLQEAFRLARHPLPSRTIYTLQNARNAGYLDSTGTGEFKLNPVGYNLVEHGLGGADEVKSPVSVRHRSSRGGKIARKRTTRRKRGKRA